MSALAKPHLKFTNAINSNTVVPSEHISSFEKLDIGALPNQPDNTAKWSIAFQLVYPNSETKTVIIDFATEAARNTSFTNTVSALATAIA